MQEIIDFKNRLVRFVSVVTFVLLSSIARAAENVDPIIQRCVENTFRSYPNAGRSSECDKIKNKVNFTPAERGGDSPVTTAGYRLIHNLDDLHSLWKNHRNGHWSLPSTVNFNRATVIALFGGFKSVPMGLIDDSVLSLEFLQKTDGDYKLYVAKKEPDSTLAPAGTKPPTVRITPYVFYLAPGQIQKIDIFIYHSKTGTWESMKPLDNPR